MKIKTRLSLYFTSLSIIILLIGIGSVYLSILGILRAEFFSRLKDRATVAAQLYLKADEISQDSLAIIRGQYLEKIPTEVIRIYNSKNKATFIPEKEPHWDERVVERVRHNGYLQYMNGGRQVVGLFFRDNQGDFVVLASAQDMATDIRMRNLLGIMSIIFLVIIVLCFLMGRWVADSLLYPINQVISRMKIIRASNLNMRVDEGKGNDEISLLARNFNNLLEHLENAFELQKTFVANASHELRTPITSIIGEAEIALVKEREPAEYQRVLRSVLFDSERLGNTITGLLELAEIDMDFSRATLTPVRIDEILWELWAYWNEKLALNLLQVEIDNVIDDERSVIVNCNKSLMYIALNNLISNAFKFSNNQPVKCILRTAKNQLNIDIIDNGLGISTEELGNLFKPFYRASNVADIPGHGLGLYITNSIVSLYMGSLSIKANGGGGTVFSIQFPVE
ncbi:HAMP domain-containing sensor histidine kinase [Mucilaginibacter paludis]|uniref:histidine kinase n=1 Tax=Mucilaginibacter paludis DSM 18603 TaxID=714943 RepID=H1YAM2_9SPHI|nr:HAMP domain-containing sensor histidine kinase [Mucilaginibacter paludis]EHQ29142.1 integral membrane sensor signal transduction histidine kinase [Mucilaginibacter paludis DSM 18603]